MSKVRLATVWFSGCAGCHMSFLDLDERLVELAAKAEIVFSPVVDAKVFPENVDVTLVEGAVGNQEHLELIHQIRERSKIVVALGDCAVTGNVPSMRNAIPHEEVLHAVYGTENTPGLKEGDIPLLLPQAQPVHAHVHVDAYIHGCPPSADRIWTFVRKLLAGEDLELVGEDLRFG